MINLGPKTPLWCFPGTGMAPLWCFPGISTAPLWHFPRDRQGLSSVPSPGSDAPSSVPSPGSEWPFETAETNGSPAQRAGVCGREGGPCLHVRQPSCWGDARWAPPVATELRAEAPPLLRPDHSNSLGRIRNRVYASLPTRPFTRADTMEMTMEATKALPKLAM